MDKHMGSGNESPSIRTLPELSVTAMCRMLNDYQKTQTRQRDWRRKMIDDAVRQMLVETASGRSPEDGGALPGAVPVNGPPPVLRDDDGRQVVLVDEEDLGDWDDQVDE
ncbi:MAG: hypothetical protein LBQ79_00570 [Deltaproteobacteria bacterium]|jgi:hypothetical protein|nr:hypothetical protein [Deltaproteobacteria bacterium]